MSSEELKSNMSKEERARRRAAVGKAASERIAKSEQLNFRIEEPSIAELQSMAFNKGMPVGTMIRQWVMERLSQEKLGNEEFTGRALHVLEEIRGKLHGLFSTLPSESSHLAPKKGGTLTRATDHEPTVQEVPGCYHVHSPLLEAAILKFCELPCASTQSHDNDDGLDHLKACEHVLVDQLAFIRAQREKAERSRGK